MRKKLLRGFVFLLSISMLIGLLPAFALAADEELVLTKIGHASTDAVSISDAATRAVVLTVPYSYSGTTVDLADGGLSLDKAAGITTVIPNFESGSTATVGDPGSPGPVVTMTILYYKGTDTTTQYTTLYTISLVRAAKVEPTFTGTITKSFTGVMPNSAENDITFSQSDFESRYKENDGGPITAVSISGTSLACGSLKIDNGGTYVVYNAGDKINIDQVGNLIFDAENGGSVSYIVSAYAGTETPIGSVLLTITINDIAVPTLSPNSTVTKTVNPNSNVTFSTSDFTSMCNLNGGTFASIEITPADSGNGTWYNGAGAFTVPTVFTAATISNLRFTASSAGTEAFTWRVSNEAGFSLPGNGIVTINPVSLPTISTAVSKSVMVGSTITFSLSDFSSHYNLNNGTFKNIVVTPANNTYGTWYKGSAVFTASTTFTESDISTLKFKGTQTGTAAFTWTVANNEKGASAAGSGSITVQASTATITYTTAMNTAKTFSSSDFSTACRNATGGTLSYVTFAALSTSYGRLYSGYSSASSPGTPVASGSQVAAASLSAITFVPATAYNGVVNVTFTGVTTGGVSFSGTVRITVGDAGDVAYTTAVNTPKTFSAAGFNNACSAVTGGGTLSYLYFTPPSTSYGRLYTGYVSPTNPGTVITSSTQIAASSISSITFVPATNYTGTVSITYTGYTTGGISFTGHVKITVGSTAEITYTTAVNTPKTFVANDFRTACSTATNGGTLSHVYFTIPSSSYGRLYYGYTSSTSPGTAITSSDQITASYISNITFVPALNYTGTVTIAFTGYTTGSASFTGNIKITVSNSSDVTYTTAVNTPKTFLASDFRTACSAATNGGTLSHVYFTIPSSSYGRLYYGYTSSSSPGTAITSSDQITAAYISNVTFVPTLNYTGSFTITYTGYTTGSTSYTGYVKITVGNTTDVTYTTAVNTPKTFLASDFRTACSAATNGGTLASVSFTLPSTSYGRLYYGYTSSSSPGTAITSSDQITAAYISNVTFVPALNYTGSFTITYTGYTTGGSSYTGYIKMTVGSTSEITYTTSVNTPKTFTASDFTEACSAATNGGALSYLYFTIPSATYGKLYYGYSSSTSPGTAITSSTQIDVSYISDVTFVPALNYTGSFTITYTGYTIGGISYTGYVKITVGNNGNVTYSTGKNTAKAFSAADFNAACTSATGLGLSYIVITPPSAVYGKLYRNYTSSTNTGTAITAATALYYSGTPGISSVSFVPASNYTGTVTIAYTGYNTNGATYQGSVIIKVTETARDLTYTIKNNQTLTFSSIDIDSVCSSTTGERLSYVYITLPASTYGKLYYNYTSPSSTGSAVSASTAYYNAYTPYINYITFVPTAGYTGSVTISYTGYNVSGASFTGKIIIQVNKSTGSAYFTDVGEAYDWAAGAIDYLYNAGIIKGTGGTTYTPGANMTRGDFMLMLYRAMGFKGTTSTNFSDVPTSSYYYEAIAAARALGIAKGDNNKFYPNAPLTRQDAMVLIYRALLLTGKTLITGTASDLSGFSDTGSIAGYAQTAVASLVKAGMVKGAYGKINPLGTMTRAEMAVVLYRVKITYL